MRLKWIGTWSKRESKLRIARIIWRRGEVGKGGHSSMLSVGIEKRFWRRQSAALKIEGWFLDWRLTICGLALHYERSYGGIHV